MKILLLALLLPLMSQEIAPPRIGPWVESKPVVIENLYLDERSGTLTIHLLRTRDGQYHLKLIVNTKAWGMKEPGNVTVLANGQELNLPCSTMGSIETVEGPHGIDHWSMLVTSSPQLTPLLEQATSIKLVIGRYKLTLRSDQLNALMTFPRGK